MDVHSRCVCCRLNIWVITVILLQESDLRGYATQRILILTRPHETNDKRYCKMLIRIYAAVVSTFSIRLCIPHTETPHCKFSSDVSWGKQFLIFRL